MKKSKPDRRTERTRQALNNAFIGMLLEDGYESVSVERIAERANVGRSTFYMHFKSKEDILRHSMTNPSASLAKVVGGDLGAEIVVPLLEHFKDQRKRNRVFFVSPIRSIWVGRLAELIESRLETLARAAGGRPLLPLQLIAVQIAECQIGLIAGWLSSSQPFRTDLVAESLIATTRAIVSASLRTRGSAAPFIPGERLALRQVQ
jgi:AcrR family transcriptional regulator